MSQISTALEAHREILLRLTGIAQLNPKEYYPSDNDSLCRFCGIRPRRGNLCSECDTRRERLAKQFPDVPPPVRQARAPLSARQKSASGMTALGAIERPIWTPHNSE